MIYNTCARFTECLVELAQKTTPSAPLAPTLLSPTKRPPFSAKNHRRFSPSPIRNKQATDTAHIYPMKSQYRLPIKSFWGLGLRPYLRQPLFNLCCRGKEKAGTHRRHTKRGALVPRRQPSPRSVVFRRRPENKVFRLVARQNPFTEGVLAAPPVPLKVKATDTALIIPMKNQYRLPINLFWGLGLRPYLRQPLFNLYCRGKREEMQNPRKRDSSCVPTNYVHWSEKSFVCLRHFRIRGNACTIEEG